MRHRQRGDTRTFSFQTNLIFFGPVKNYKENPPRRLKYLKVYTIQYALERAYNLKTFSSSCRLLYKGTYPPKEYIFGSYKEIDEVVLSLMQINIYEMNLQNSLIDFAL